MLVHEENNKIKDFSKYEAYNEFTSYLAERENESLNIITDIEQIKSNLKLGFQHERQEVFGCLLYDENYNIQKTLNLFKGGIASSIVDTRILFKEVLKNEAAGFIVYHNHPSGTTVASNEDISITKRISKVSDDLGLEFCDHFIIGKEQVLSFAKDVDSMLFNNIDYILDIVNVRESDSKYKASHEEFEEKENIFYEQFEELCDDLKLNYEVEYEKFEKIYEEFKENTPKSDLDSYIDFWDDYNASIRLEYLYWNDDNSIFRFEKAIKNNNIESATSQNSDFEDTKKTISNMIYSNYENYVKAIISLEKGIDDMDILDKIYSEFMNDDDIVLLGSDIDLLEKKILLSNENNLRNNRNDNKKSKYELDNIWITAYNRIYNI